MDAMDRPEKVKLGQLRKAYARNGLCVLFSVSLCGGALALIIQYSGPRWVHTEAKISLEVCNLQRKGAVDCGGGMGYLECIIVMRLLDRYAIIAPIYMHLLSDYCDYGYFRLAC